MFAPFRSGRARGVAREGFTPDFDLPPANGRIVERVGRMMVKRWTGAWSPRITYALKAKREFDNLVALERGGVPVAKPLACFWTDFEAALVTEAIDGAVEMRERPEGAWGALAAATAKAIDAGLDHPDLHLGNVLVRGGEVYFVDLQEARVGAPSREAAYRTLGFLMHSIVEALSAAGRLRLLGEIRSKSAMLAKVEWREVVSGVEAAFRASRVEYFKSRVGRVTTASALTEVEGAWVLSKSRPIDAETRRRLESVDTLPILKEVDGRSVHRWRELFVKRGRHAADAWRNAWAMKLRGLPVAEPRGLWKRVVVTDWVEGTPLPEFVEENYGAWPRERQVEFLRALAAVVRRLHARGVYPYDLKGGNVLATAAGFAIIDLDHVEYYEETPLDARLQNLAQLCASVAGAVTRADRLRFLRFYAGRDRAFWRAVKGHAFEVYRRAVARRHRWPPQSR